MRQDWIDFISGQGADDRFESFGQPAVELAAARDATVVAPLPDFGLIRAVGEDAAPFLHNLLTNDINHIPADGARHAGMCTAKGRLIASFLIWREGGDYLLQLSADILPAIHKKLSMYVLRSKVKLADLNDERVLIGIAGPQAASLVDAVVGSGVLPHDDKLRTATFAQGTAIRLGAQRFVLAVKAEAAADVWQKLASEARPAGLAAWRLGEIAAGQPRIVAATQEAFVPQMVNYELAAIDGVSFKKGCYPGQEIVARTHYLGKVKRRMYRASADTLVAPGTDVFTTATGDQHCGAIVLSAPAPEGEGAFECLVVVQSSGAESGEVHVGKPDGPRLKLLPLPYAVD